MERILQPISIFRKKIHDCTNQGFPSKIKLLHECSIMFFISNACQHSEVLHRKLADKLQWRPRYETSKLLKFLVRPVLIQCSSTKNCFNKSPWLNPFHQEISNPNPMPSVPCTMTSPPTTSKWSTRLLIQCEPIDQILLQVTDSPFRTVFFSGRPRMFHHFLHHQCLSTF